MREKLIELLMDMPLWRLTYEEMERYAENVADYLIANGVTFATDNNVGCKWIPVTERLPHPNEVVMTWSQQRADLEVINVLADFEMGDVTHWMPLPEPPKGE